MKKRTILIISANPKNTARLRLDEEVREISEGLTRAKHREQYTICQQWAVRLRDLRRAMLENEPHIVHFCGHAEEEGLMVENENGSANLINTEALSGLFALFEDQVECVLLNACHSQAQAYAINRHVKYVIGMGEEINDNVAIEFAVGFYDALGAGKTVEEAFKFGISAIQFYDVEDDLMPILSKQPPEIEPKPIVISGQERTASFLGKEHEQYLFFKKFSAFRFMEQIELRNIRTIKILCFTGKFLLVAVEKKLQELIEIREKEGRDITLEICIFIKHPESESLRRSLQIEATVAKIQMLRDDYDVNIGYFFYEGLPNYRGIVCKDRKGKRFAYLSSYEWLPQKNQAAPYAILVNDSPEEESPLITMFESWLAHYQGKSEGKIHTLIFDFDDTLAPTMHIQVKAWMAAIESALTTGYISVEDLSPAIQQVRDDEQTYYNCLQKIFIQHQIAEKIIAAILPDMQNEEIKKIIDEERFSIRKRLLMAEGKLFDGVADKLSALQHKYHIAVVTATSGKLVRRFLRKEKVEHCFTLILGKYDPKSQWDRFENKAALLLQVSGQLGVPLDRFVYIGDNLSDYIACKQVGIQFIEAAQTAKMIGRETLINSKNTVIQPHPRFESFDENDHTLNIIIDKLNAEDEWK